MNKQRKKKRKQNLGSQSGEGGKSPVPHREAMLGQKKYSQKSKIGDRHKTKE